MAEEIFPAPVCSLKKCPRFLSDNIYIRPAETLLYQDQAFRYTSRAERLMPDA